MLITQLEICYGEEVQQVLAIASREIVAAQACYHRTCYEGYTRAEASPTGASDGCGESLEDESQKPTRCFAITSDQMFLQTRK